MLNIYISQYIIAIMHTGYKVFKNMRFVVWYIIILITYNSIIYVYYL